MCVCVSALRIRRYVSLFFFGVHFKGFQMDTAQFLLETNPLGHGKGSETARLPIEFHGLQVRLTTICFFLGQGPVQLTQKVVFAGAAYHDWEEALLKC